MGIGGLGDKLYCNWKGLCGILELLGCLMEQDVHVEIQAGGGLAGLMLGLALHNALEIKVLNC